jgi:hypothetical protein
VDEEVDVWPLGPDAEAVALAGEAGLQCRRWPDRHEEEGDHDREVSAA